MISVSVRLTGRLSPQDSVMTVSALKADGTKQAAKSRTVPKLWMKWAQLQTTALPGIIIRPSPKRFQKSTKSCSHQGLWSCQVRTPASVGSLLISQIFLIIHDNAGTTTLQWFCFWWPGVSFPLSTFAHTGNRDRGGRAVLQVCTRAQVWAGEACTVNNLTCLLGYYHSTLRWGSHV